MGLALLCLKQSKVRLILYVVFFLVQYVILLANSPFPNTYLYTHTTYNTGDSLWVRIQAPPHLMRYIVPKGFIAIDGTSLTICDVDQAASVFSFMLISHTQASVIIPAKPVGKDWMGFDCSGFDFGSFLFYTHTHNPRNS